MYSVTHCTRGVGCSRSQSTFSTSDTLSHTHEIGSLPFSLSHSLLRLSHLLRPIVQYTGGLISFLYPGVQPSLRRSILPYHSYIGLLLTVLPTVTISLGLLEKTTFMQSAATRSQADEVAQGRWLANSAGMLALACMAAVLYVLSSGGEAVRNGEDGGEREAAEAEKADEAGGEEEVEAVNGDQVEGQRSVFSVPVPYPAETSSLLHSGDDGKHVIDAPRQVEDSAPPASFSTYVDEMLDKHFSRRASRDGNPPSVAVRVDEYGSTAQYRREPDRHSSRSTSAATSATASRRESGTAGERVELVDKSRIEPEEMSPTSPESMWPRFKGVGASGVILK